jgi:beta-phosphoglucomutase-like phosphatase (HAD superfamily)
MVTGSSRRSLESVLTQEQSRWFDVIITADDVVRGKPAPDPFLSAAQALHAAPETCLVVENAPFGIQAASAAGCFVVALGTTLTKADLSQANRIVRDHAELEMLLFGDVPKHTDNKIDYTSGAER